MNKFKSLGKVLSKTEQKRIIGGFEPPAGSCYTVYSTQGYSGCWYITGNPVDLCHRVYGDNCSATSDGPVDCQANNCVMN